MKTKTKSLTAEIAPEETKPSSNKTNSFFSASLKMSGVLSTEGNIRLDGEYEGKIESAGTVFLGEKALVKGDIECGSIVASGKVEGNVKAVDEVSLRSPCVYKGEILASRINIEDNVTFNAACRLVEPTKLKKSAAPLVRRLRSPINYDSV